MKPQWYQKAPQMVTGLSRNRPMGTPGGASVPPMGPLGDICSNFHQMSRFSTPGASMFPCFRSVSPLKLRGFSSRSHTQLLGSRASMSPCFRIVPPFKLRGFSGRSLRRLSGSRVKEGNSLRRLLWSRVKEGKNVNF